MEELNQGVVIELRYSSKKWGFIDAGKMQADCRVSQNAAVREYLVYKQAGNTLWPVIHIHSNVVVLLHSIFFSFHSIPFPLYPVDHTIVDEFNYFLDHEVFRLWTQLKLSIRGIESNKL